MSGATTDPATPAATRVPVFRVLFVSTGNVCRSPMAERMLGRRLAVALGTASIGFRCESAGIWGHEGAGMEPFATEVLAEQGARADGFVARELTGHQIAMADLVLGATGEHSDQVVALDPFAMRRTFTIGEFARLARAVEQSTLPPRDPVARARVLVERAADLRVPDPARVRQDDIEDPYGAPLQSFRLCAAAIADGLSGLLEALRPSTRAGLADASS